MPKRPNIVADALLHRMMRGGNNPAGVRGISIARPNRAALNCPESTAGRTDRRHRNRAAPAAIARESNAVKTLVAILIAGCVGLAAAPCIAADAATPNPQQERMKTCNAKAGDKKGDERKKFMSDCLSAEKKVYDSKMSECNTKSKGMKAEERNKFMSECMKKAA